MSCIVFGNVNTLHASPKQSLNLDITEAEILNLIRSAERKYNIPSGLLLAIARTESSLKPYALNIQGKSITASSRSEALKLIYDAKASGITNIDIGIAQINYKWHQHNFSSLESMISPPENIIYAAKLLSSLKKSHGDWHKAIRHYHSSLPERHKQYSRKVVLCWFDS